MSIDSTLNVRSGGRCELCSATEGLAARPVSPRPDAAVLCETCNAQVSDAGAALDPNHWVCLRDAAWSEHPAIQVLAVRLLERLGEPWALELREQLYLDEDTRSWAADVPAGDARPSAVDSHGAVLREGDSVTLIKDLDVKGAGFTAKRGTLVKGIKLGDDPGLVEGRVNGVAIYLKTEFLKRA
ncbi:MAG: PhnA domain-containing protein [Planctomycetota bacterium]